MSLKVAPRNKTEIRYKHSRLFRGHRLAAGSDGPKVELTFGSDTKLVTLQISSANPDDVRAEIITLAGECGGPSLIKL